MVHLTEKMKSLALGLTLLAGVSAAAKIEVVNSPSDRPDWAFRPGDKVTVKVDAASADSFDIRDFYGNKWNAADRKQEGDAVLFTLPTQHGGLFTIKAGKDSVRYAVVPAPSRPIAEENRFGVNFHFDRTPPEINVKEAKYATFIGISWGRGMIMDFVNCKSNNYPESTRHFDPVLELAKSSGMFILGNIYFSPPFVHAEKGPDFIWYAFTVPEDMTEVNRYAEFMAKKCPYITYWEVGNENDAEHFWRGRASSVGQPKKIIEDYVDFLRAASTGFKAGNPNCKVLFAGCTGGLPEGETHKPFLKTSCEAGALDLVDVMNLHYSGSIPRCREVMAPYLKGRKYDFWVTEMGRHAAGTGSLEEREICQTREDLLHVMEQFSDGAAKVFKYNMRNKNLDGAVSNTNNPEDNFGLITQDLQPKLPYLSYASMIRLIEGSTGMHRINITKCSDKGFLKGFSWKLDGTEYSCVVLEAADKAVATLPVSDPEITCIDVFGNEKVYKAIKGKISVPMNGMPLFFRGRLNPPAGEVVYPAETVVRTIKVNINNARFKDGVNGWNCGFPKDTTKIEKTPAGIKITFDMMNYNGYAWLLNWGDIDIGKLQEQLNPKQFVKVRVRGELRYDLKGRGVNLGCNFCPARYQGRLRWNETSFTSAKSDWTVFELLSEPWKKGENAAALTFNAAPGSAGWFEVRNTEMFVEIWQKP